MRCSPCSSHLNAGSPVQEGLGTVDILEEGMSLELGFENPKD